MLKVTRAVYNTAYPTFSLNTEVVDSRYQPINSGEVIHTTTDKDYEYFVKSTSEPGVFQYGAKQLHADPVWGHGVGYVWSSRCSVMNYLFGTRLVEVYINNRCYAMDVDMLQQLVDRDLEDKFELIQSYDDEEVRYQFKKI